MSQITPSVVCQSSGQHHHLALQPFTDNMGYEAAPMAWACAVGAVAAWPQEEMTQPVLERRLWRAGGRGRLQQAVIAGLHDPLGLHSQAQAQTELRELLRPLWSAMPLRPLSKASRTQLARPSVGYAIELSLLESILPEGNQTFLPTFFNLLEGLTEIPGPVGLSMLVLPRLEPDDQPADEPDRPDQVRAARFALRIYAASPIPASLRARAEVLCMARRRRGSWQLSQTPAAVAAATAAIAQQLPIGPADDWICRTDIAALTLALPAPVDPARAQQMMGRPVTQKLPRSGPVLGRVPRPDGRMAEWRLPWSERTTHTLITGTTGCGKTTALLRLALDDIEANRSTVLFDFHGDIAAQLACAAPRKRLIVIDPRLEQTAALDLLDGDPARAAAHLMSAVAEVWPADWAGPAWLRSISLSCRCLHASPLLKAAPTLADLEQFIVDPVFRQRVVLAIDTDEHPSLVSEIKLEHRAWQQPRDDTSMVNWVASKLTPLTRGPGRSLFTALPHTKLEDAIGSGAVILVVLPVGTLGAAIAGLAARMFLTRLTTAIAQQSDLPETERRPLSVFVDEAHFAAGAALAGLFAQARKFNCSITVACQNPSQLGRELDGILTNAHTHLHGRLAPREAELLAARVGPIGVRALTRLPKYHLLAALESTDPDLAPVILSPVPPPAVSACYPEFLTDHADTTDLDSFDEWTASLFD